METAISPVAIPGFFAGITSLALGIYVLKKNYDDRASRVFFILMLGCGIWSLGEFFMQLTTVEWVGNFGGMISNVGFIFIPISLFHFSIAYGQRSRKEKKGGRGSKSVKLGSLIWGLYIIPVIISALIMTSTLFFTIQPVVEADRELTYEYDGPENGTANGTANGLKDGGRSATAEYHPLFDNETGSEKLEWWWFRDVDGDKLLSFSDGSPEPLMRNNGTTVLILDNGTIRAYTANRTDGNRLGNGSAPGSDDRNNRTDANGSERWVPLRNATNHGSLYISDNSGGGAGTYDIGESIYLDNGNGEWDPDWAIWVKDNAEYKNFIYVQGPLYMILILLFFLFIIGSLGYFFKEYLIRRDPAFRKQARFMIMGLLIITLIILFEPLSSIFMPTIVVDSFLTLMISLFFAVAVLKYNLMDIQLIIKKSLTYSMVVLVIAFVFTVVGEAVEFGIGKLLPKFSELFSNIIAALIVSVLFIPLTNYTKKLFNRLFPKLAKYDEEYAARISAYEATVEAMWQDRKLTSKEMRAIGILRKKLNVTKNEHREIMEKHGSNK